MPLFTRSGDSEVTACGSVADMQTTSTGERWGCGASSLCVSGQKRGASMRSRSTLEDGRAGAGIWVMLSGFVVAIVCLASSVPTDPLDAFE